MMNNTVQYNWESLPLEERKKRVAIRKQNLGMYKDVLVINNPKLRGDS